MFCLWRGDSYCFPDKENKVDGCVFHRRNMLVKRRLEKVLLKKYSKVLTQLSAQKLEAYEAGIGYCYFRNL
jgi:hypothetical protein